LTIENEDVIDTAGVDKETGEIVLTISDHLPWQDSGRHCRLLEKKISRYLEFVRGGQILKQFPQAAGTPVRINLICEHDLTEFALRFLAAAREQLGAAGITFSYGKLPAGY
jgi:hypothetical protein